MLRERKRRFVFRNFIKQLFALFQSEFAHFSFEIWNLLHNNRNTATQLAWNSIRKVVSQKKKKGQGANVSKCRRQMKGGLVVGGEQAGSESVAIAAAVAAEVEDFKDSGIRGDSHSLPSSCCLSSAKLLLPLQLAAPLLFSSPPLVLHRIIPLSLAFSLFFSLWHVNLLLFHLSPPSTFCCCFDCVSWRISFYPFL